MSSKNKGSDVLEFELGDYLDRRTLSNNKDDIEAIDQEVWDKYGEDWAIVYTDLSGFTREAYNRGIMYTLEAIHTFRRIVLPIVAELGGIVIKTEGDSLMILFKRAIDALDFARKVNQELGAYNLEHHGNEIFNGSGIAYGRIIKLGNQDIYGLEVNLASKLGEDMAAGNEILITEGAKLEIEKTMILKGDYFIMDERLQIRAFRVL